MKLRYIVLCAVAGVILGCGVAVYRIADVEHSKAFFTNGNWTGTNQLPLGKDALLTTQITLFAMYALPSEEAVYLMSRRDDAGERFHSRNDYAITGNLHDIDAGYWSITAYGTDLYLVPNKAERYSFNNTNIAADSAGNFRILLSAREQKGNWLPIPEDAEFNLLLRIYQGNNSFLQELSATPLPRIEKLKP